MNKPAQKFKPKVLSFLCDAVLQEKVSIAFHSNWRSRCYRFYNTSKYWSRTSFSISQYRCIIFHRVTCMLTFELPKGPLQDSVTWYGINYTGTQMTQWDFQNKGKSGWPGKNSFVLKVPLRHLRPSVIYSVPCDQILQRAYLRSFRSVSSNI